MSDIRASQVRFEHHRAALGTGEPAPRLSWRIDSAPDGWRQVAYEVEVDSVRHRVESPESVLVPWPAASLQSRDRRTVRVRVTGTDGETSPWSAPAAVEAGLLHTADWTARMITPGADPAPLVRKEFRLDAPVASARLYLTAHGLYRADINGQPVSDDAFAPGWTSYHHRLRYQTYDVTRLLRDGANVIGAQLADGWFRGRLSFVKGKRNVYGDRLGLLAQLDRRPHRQPDRRHRHRRLLALFHRAGHIGRPVRRRALRRPARTARLVRPGLRRQRLAALLGDRFRHRHLGGARRTPGPRRRRGAGQRGADLAVRPDAAGLRPEPRRPLRIRVSGASGTVMTLRHAEVLEHGELAVRPLRTATATDSYTLRGDPSGEEWEPRFTFHGFRYAEVTGWPGELHKQDVTAVVYHSDLERTGWFECSDPLLTRLHENVVWGMRGNFLDVPTDCPQRDERLGWTGDIQVFAPTAAYLYDCAGFLASWLKDLAADQTPVGSCRFTCRESTCAGPSASRSPRLGGVTPRCSSRGSCTSASTT